MSFIRIVFCAFLIVLMACSDEPARTGPATSWMFCELNGATFQNKAEYDDFCNDEGIKIYDSLEREGEFAAQYLTEEQCKDDSSNVFVFSYNYYTGYFDFFIKKDSVLIEMKRGHIYKSEKNGIFVSSDSFHSDSIECCIPETHYIYSKELPFNPTDTLKNLSTCQDKIKVVLTLFNICQK